MVVPRSSKERERETSPRTTELKGLKLKRAELQHQIAQLEGARASLYSPGITLVPQEGPAPNEIDQQIEQLRAALVEIDTAISAANEVKKPDPH